jgi:hypothetical protein
LTADGFSFTKLPTKNQTARFEYVVFDYIKDNPGTRGNKYSSYVGKHYDDDGTTSE